MLRTSIHSFCAIALVVFGSVASADESGWGIESSPNAPTQQHNFLNDVACVSESDCWSIGYHRAPGAYQAIMQRWDGRSWSLVPTPDTSALRDEFVQGVACASKSQCWGVGFSWSRPDNAYRSLILEWNGTTWSDVALQDGAIASNNFLLDATCASPSRCWAVGYQQTGLLGGGFGPNQTLIMEWDGVSWERVASPNTLPTQGNMLASVSCVTSSDCWAVGSYAAGSADQSLALHWNGSSWEIEPSPNTSPTQQNILNGVTCVGPDDCWAVGITTPDVNQTVAQHWDGRSWSIVATPNTDPSLPNVLFNVACSSPSECWAVGYHKTGTLLQTLIQRWDGKAWSIEPSPNSSPGETNTLRAVACDERGCWAVGNYYNAQSISRTFVTRYRADHAVATATELDLTLARVRGDIEASAQLRSVEGTPIAGKELVFSINGLERARGTTDSRGLAAVSFHRNEIKQGDEVETRFLGDDSHAPSQASIQVSN